MKKNIFIFVLAVSLLAYFFTPRSNESSYERAKDELDYYCEDLRLDCSVFKSQGLSSDTGQARSYSWKNMITNESLTINVPYYIIGDYTFGLWGSQVVLYTSPN